MLTYTWGLFYMSPQKKGSILYLPASKKGVFPSKPTSIPFLKSSLKSRYDSGGPHLSMSSIVTPRFQSIPMVKYRGSMGYDPSRF